MPEHRTHRRSQLILQYVVGWWEKKEAIIFAAAPCSPPARPCDCKYARQKRREALQSQIRISSRLLLHVV